MISVSSAFNWAGDKVSDLLFGEINRRLDAAGAAWLQQSRALAPKRTGYLASQEGYRVEGRTLVLVMGASYDIFTEFGTRRMAPRPHVRPAMDYMGRIFGADILMDFNTTAVGPWTGIHAHEGGFIVPSAIQPRPLTRAQHEHVRRHLLPTSQALHRGNVRRARMRVRRFD